MAGLAVSSIVAFVTIHFTVATTRHPHTGVQAIFGVAAVFSVLCAGVIYEVERRLRKRRKDFLDALGEELDAAERYMRMITEGPT